MKKNTNYFKVPNLLVDEENIFATIYEAFIYTTLCRYTNNEQIAYPSLITLSKKCHCSKNTLLKTLRALEEKGCIKVKLRKGEKNRYQSSIYTVIDLKEILAKREEEVEDSSSSDALDMVQQLNKGSSSPALGVVHQMHWDSSCGEPKEEQYINNKYKKNNIKNYEGLKKELVTRLQQENISHKLYQVLLEYLDYRVEIGKKIKTYRVFTTLLNQLGKRYLDEQHLIDSIENSISCQYQGVFPVNIQRRKESVKESYVTRRLRELEEEEKRNGGKKFSTRD